MSEFIHEELAATYAVSGAEFKSGESALVCFKCGSTELVIIAG